MRFINKCLFTIKEAFSGLVKNFPKTIIQFAVCFVSLTFFSVIFGINLNVQNAAENMRSQIEISVFLKDNIDNSEFLAIENKIKSNPNVKNYIYKSREEARREGTELLKDYPEMLSSLEDFEDHPFPSSFTIELSDVTETESFAKEFYDMPGVETDGVKFGEEYMEKVISLSSGLKYGSIVALIFFFVIAVFFMMSIINVIISAKDKQCSIMFLIGASPSQIRIPFYIQGTLIGLVSSILSYIVFKYTYEWIISHFGFALVDISTLSTQFFIFISFVGISTGLLATKIALNKFNKISKKTAQLNR